MTGYPRLDRQSAAPCSPLLANTITSLPPLCLALIKAAASGLPANLPSAAKLAGT